MILINILDLLDSLLDKEDLVAKQIVEDAGYVYRVIRIGKKYLPITQDFNPKRINIIIGEGKVVTADIG